MIDYILPYSPFILVGVICASAIYKALFGDSKVVSGFLIFSILTFFFFIIIYPNFTSRPHHCNCKRGFEGEAGNIAAAIADYFAIPTRTQIPTISDLVSSGSYILLENRDLKRRHKLVKESEFSVAISGDEASEITIVVNSKEGKCPFVKGKCPWSKGEVYVLKMGSSEGGKWLDSWEEI